MSVTALTFVICTVLMFVMLFSVPCCIVLGPVDVYADSKTQLAVGAKKLLKVSHDGHVMLT